MSVFDDVGAVASGEDLAELCGDGLWHTDSRQWLDAYRLWETQECDFGLGREGGTSQSLDALRDNDAFKRMALIEGIFADMLKSFTEFDLCQRCAAVECRLADGCDGGREGELIEAEASAKGTVTDRE